MSDSDFDMELLIEELKVRPIIWDSKQSKFFENKDLKNKAWEELCEVFDRSYYQRSAEKQANVCNALKRKYKSLRDSYHREVNLQNSEKKAGKSKTNRKRYIYFDQLHFLSRDVNSVTQSGIPADPCKTPEWAMETPEPNPQGDIQSSDLVTSSLTESKKTAEDKLFLLSLVQELGKIPEENRLPSKIDILQNIKKWQPTLPQPQQEPQKPELQKPELQKPELQMLEPQKPEKPNVQQSEQLCIENINNYQFLPILQTSENECPICHRLYRNKYIAKTHLKLHIKDGLFTCVACPVGFRTVTELALHVRMHGKVPKLRRKKNRPRSDTNKAEMKPRRSSMPTNNTEYTQDSNVEFVDVVDGDGECDYKTEFSASNDFYSGQGDYD